MLCRSRKAGGMKVARWTWAVGVGSFAEACLAFHGFAPHPQGLGWTSQTWIPGAAQQITQAASQGFGEP